MNSEKSLIQYHHLGYHSGGGVADWTHGEFVATIAVTTSVGAAGAVDNNVRDDKQS